MDLEQQMELLMNWLTESEAFASDQKPTRWFLSFQVLSFMISGAADTFDIIPTPNLVEGQPGAHRHKSAGAVRSEQEPEP